MKKESWIAFLIFPLLYYPFIQFAGNQFFAGSLDFETLHRALGHPRVWRIFIESLGMAAASTILGVAGGFVVSFTVLKANVRWGKAFAFLFVAPLAIPPFVYVESILFLSELFSVNLFTRSVMILLEAIAYLPLSAIVLASGFNAIPQDLEDSARLSAKGNRWFHQITLRWMIPHFAAAAILTFIFVFSSYEIPSLMGVQTYTLHVFNRFGSFYDYSEAICLLVPVMVLFVILIFAAAKVVNRRPFFSLAIRTARTKVALGSAGKMLLPIVMAVLAFLILLPFAVIVSKAFGKGAHPSDILPYGAEISYSFFVSIAGASVSILLGALVVRPMALGYSRTRALLWVISLVAFAVPSSLLAIGLIEFSANFPGEGNVGATISLIWGLAARYFPVVVQVLYAGAVALSPRLEEAGRLSQKSWWTNMRKIWFPLNKHTMSSAFFFFLLLSLGEIALAVLLVPPNRMTASINIYAMLHYGFGKEVAQETLLLLVPICAAAVLLLKNRNSNHT